MKAIKVTEPFHLNLVEVPDPEIKDSHDVILKILSGGICGSDIQIWNGTNSLATYPRIIGHEFGGVVVETGSDVHSVKPGDLAAVDPVLSCGSCYACRIGRPNVCVSLKVMGVHCDGGFSQYVCVPESNVHKFFKNFPAPLLSLVEPYTIGAQVNSRASISKDDCVFIMGSGPIGLTVLQTAKNLGAQVIISDLLPQRLKSARSMGADETLLASDPLFLQRLYSFSGQDGVPVVVDTVCTPASLEEAVSFASPAGKIVCLGLKNQPSAIAMYEITKKELTLVGSRLSNRRFDEVIRHFEAGDYTPDQLITHQIHYSQIQEAFELLIKHPELTLKVGLTFE